MNLKTIAKEINEIFNKYQKENININEMKLKDCENIKEYKHNLAINEILEKYPILSKNFLKTISNNIEKDLIEYFTKYSDVMGIVNMLINSLELNSKKTISEEYTILDIPLKKTKDMPPEYINTFITNKYFGDLQFEVKENPINAEIKLANFCGGDIDSVVCIADSFDCYFTPVFAYLTENTQNLIKEDVNQDVRKKIETDGLTDRQITNILKYLNINKNYKIEDLSDEKTKKEICDMIYEYDFSKHNIEVVIEILKNIY